MTSSFIIAIKPGREGQISFDQDVILRNIFRFIPTVLHEGKFLSDKRGILPSFDNFFLEIGFDQRLTFKGKRSKKFKKLTMEKLYIFKNISSTRSTIEKSIEFNCGENISYHRIGNAYLQYDKTIGKIAAIPGDHFLIMQMLLE